MYHISPNMQAGEIYWGNYGLFQIQMEQLQDNSRKFNRKKFCMQEHLYRHFGSPGGHTGLLKNVSLALISKTDRSDPKKREDYQRKTLKTMASFGLNIEDSVQ